MQAPPGGSAAGNAEAPPVQTVCTTPKADPEGVALTSERLSFPKLETVSGRVPDCPPKPRLPAEKYARGAPIVVSGGMAATTGMSTAVMVSLAFRGGMVAAVGASA